MQAQTHVQSQVNIWCGTERGSTRRRAFEVATSRWQHVPLSFQQFCDHLDRLGHVDRVPSHVASVYLCAACHVGLPAACKALEESYFPALRGAVWPVISQKDSVEDVLQHVRDRLLVGQSPKIATYLGKGSFRGWLRAIALNAARDHQRRYKIRCKRASSLESCPGDLCLGTPVGPVSPEDSAFEAEYTGACQQALLDTMSAIPASERQLLRHYFVAGLSIDQIGLVYSVDRSTAARRIARTLRGIRTKFRKALRQGLQHLDERELNSLVPSMCNQLSVSASVLFGVPQNGGTASAAPDP